MISQLAGAGIRVPGGFATTATRLSRVPRARRPGGSASRDSAARPRRRRRRARSPAPAPKSARWIVEAPLPAGARTAEIDAAYRSADSHASPDASFAVRSSATAEDLPDASFAGQQETFLNINGLDNILHAIQEVFASLYNDRAIAYRVHKGYRARRRRAVGRRAADGAQRPRRRRRDVHARHRVGLRPGGVHHRRVRPGRDRRAGRGQSGRVLRLQAQPRRAAGRRSCARRVGGKAHQDGVHRRAQRPASPPSTVDVPADERDPLFDHRRRSRGARRAPR